MKGALVLAALLAALATPGVAQNADWSWRLRDLDGREVTLEQWRGQVLFVNVWATWCPPCVAELSSIERLAKSLDGQGVTFLLVSPEPARRVRRFLAGRGYDLPMYVEASRMPRTFGLVGVPATWIIDRNGQVVLQRHGAARWDQAPVRDFLLGLARGPGSAYNSADPAGPRPE